MLTPPPNIVASQAEPYVVDLGPDHRAEYWFVDGEMWVRETRNGRTLEQPIADALHQDPMERACFFAGVDPQGLI